MTTTAEAVIEFAEGIGLELTDWQREFVQTWYDAAPAGTGTFLVTSTPTVCDGTVLRWYRSEHAARYGNESISASRNGVFGQHGHHLNPGIFNAAWSAHLRLAADRDADMSDLVTHKVGFLDREVTAVK